MVRSSAHSASELLIFGTVTYQKRCKNPAPSMQAASYCPAGTDCRAAYKSRNTNGTFCHTSMSRIVPKAVSVSINQL